MPTITDEERHERHKRHEEYEEAVYREAIFVGLTFLPVWLLVQRSTEFMRINTQHKDKLDVVLAGSVYHLIAEASGINVFYLKHGAAVKKILGDTLENVADGSVVVSDIGWLCDVYPSRDC